MTTDLLKLADDKGWAMPSARAAALRAQPLRVFGQAGITIAGDD